MNSGNVACPKCGVSVPRSALETHLHQDFRYIPYQCGLCWIRFATLASASAHFSARATRHPGRQPDIIEALDDDVEGAIRLLLDATKEEEITKDESVNDGQAKYEDSEDAKSRIFPTLQEEVQRTVKVDGKSARPAVDGKEELPVHVSQIKTHDLQSQIRIRSSEDVGGNDLSLSYFEENAGAKCKRCGRPVMVGQMAAHVSLFHAHLTHFSCNSCNFICFSQSGDGKICRHLRDSHQINNPRESDFSTSTSSSNTDHVRPASKLQLPDLPENAKYFSNDQKIKCLECGQMIVSSRRNYNSHVVARHLDDYGISCRKCSFGSRDWNGGIRVLLKHVEKIHHISEHTSMRECINDRRTSYLNQCKYNIMKKCFDYENENKGLASEEQPKLNIAQSQVKLHSDSSLNCQVCSAEILSTTKACWNHISGYHLSQVPWECLLCDYTSRRWYGGKKLMSTHARSHHKNLNIEDVVRDKRSALEEEMWAFFLPCFGPPTLTPNPKEEEPERVGEDSGNEATPVLKEEAETAPPPDDASCQLCGVRVMMEARRAHANSVHARVGPSLACHFCDYVEEQSVDLEGITTHLKGAHRVDVPDVRGHFADKRAEVADIVAHTVQACFSS